EVVRLTFAPCGERDWISVRPCPTASGFPDIAGLDEAERRGRVPVVPVRATIRLDAAWIADREVEEEAVLFRRIHGREVAAASRGQAIDRFERALAIIDDDVNVALERTIDDPAARQARRCLKDAAVCLEAFEVIGPVHPSLARHARRRPRVDEWNAEL